MKAKSIQLILNFCILLALTVVLQSCTDDDDLKTSGELMVDDIGIEDPKDPEPEEPIEPEPDFTPIGVVEVFNENKIDDNYILVNDASANRVYLMDKEARLIHEWTLTNNIGNDVFLLPNGKLYQRRYYAREMPIAYDEVNDVVLLSVNFFSEVWVIDHSTSTEEAKGSTGGNYNKGGDLIYRFGNPEAYENEEGNRLFRNNHFPNLLKGEDQGKLLIFSNGNGLDQSTVFELELPTEYALEANTNNEPRAEEYGLADLGISTQTTFFDLDNDGDLDCIVMNENELYGVDPINLYKMIERSPESKYFNSSHLYRNDNGKFTDITKSAGLERPIFGLGLCVSDINKDGLLDIYIASDYYIPDALFINNGNATFTDKIKDFTQHTSYFGMGVDIVDLNGDELQDIFVLDMSSNDHIRAKTLMASMSTDRFNYLVNDAGFQHQYMFNSLQLNLGNNKFNDIAQLTETANTDWSWSVLMSDYDNDEDADIFISNGYRKYALDNDLQKRVFEAKQKYRNKVPTEKRDGEWGLDDFSFSNGVAQGDLDNDGDLDLLVNNMDENAFLYKNLSTDRTDANYLKVETKGRNSEPFAKVRISYNGKSQQLEQKRTRGYMSSQSNSLHFGLGKSTLIDTVAITWLDGRVEEKLNVAANTMLTFDIQDSHRPKQENKSLSLFKEIQAEEIGIDYVHSENYFDDFEQEILLPYKQSTSDLFVVSGGNEFEEHSSFYADRIYLNDGLGNFSRFNTPVLNSYPKSGKSVGIIDFDNDGDSDLIVGNRSIPKNYPIASSSILYENTGGELKDVTETKAQQLTEFGIINDLVVTDFDNDGWDDVIAVGEWTPIGFFKNHKGNLKLQSNCTEDGNDGL
ncbi:Cartilage acidic protein 1 [Nymphon striatum]|nr:Cartilage acidic protein 1 [Nymphon striatum]